MRYRGFGSGAPDESIRCRPGGVTPRDGVSGIGLHSVPDHDISPGPIIGRAA